MRYRQQMGDFLLLVLAGYKRNHPGSVYSWAPHLDLIGVHFYAIHVTCILAYGREERMEWEYLVCLVGFEKLKEGGLFSKSEFAYCMMIDGKEYDVGVGLDLLGEQGWELISTPPLELHHGGNVANIYNPTLMFIFKRPVQEEVE